DEDEHPEVAVRREVVEETGHTVGERTGLCPPGTDKTRERRRTRSETAAFGGSARGGPPSTIDVHRNHAVRKNQEFPCPAAFRAPRSTRSSRPYSRPSRTRSRRP
ncbi:NUDIX domain-containing protein, partial [Streptomyces rochei]